MTMLWKGQNWRSKKTGEVRTITAMWDVANGDIYVEYKTTVSRHEIRRESFRRWAKGAELIEEKETV